MSRGRSAGVARHLALAATVATCALGGLPAPASADDCTSFFTCDLNQTQTLLVPMRNKSIAAVLELRSDNGGRARALYQRLLPPGYSMPAHPLVGLYMVTIDIPTQSLDPVDGAVRGAGDITHYLEGSLSLRAVRKGESGWFHLGMPVDSEQARTTGLAEGYPKYRAKINYTQVGGGWSADAAVSGRRTLKLAWTPAGGTPVSPDLQRFLGEPFFSLAQPLRGPERWRTRLTAMSPVPLQQIGAGQTPAELNFDNVTSVPDAQPGFVSVSLDPDLNRYDAETPDKMPDLLRSGESLADLVKTQQTVPGLYDDIQQTLLFQMNREPDRMTNQHWWEASSAPSGGGGHQPRCRTTRRHYLRVRLPARLRHARAWVGHKRVRVVRRHARLVAVIDVRRRRVGAKIRVRYTGRTGEGRRAHGTRVARNSRVRKCRRARSN